MQCSYSSKKANIELCCARVESLVSVNLVTMSAEMTVDLETFRKTQRADGPASILAIGTANPPNAVDQSTYPDYYFRITSGEQNTDLKDKFKRICKFLGFHASSPEWKKYYSCQYVKIHVVDA